jgi:hypothetical protein
MGGVGLESLEVEVEETVGVAVARNLEASLDQEFV